MLAYLLVAQKERSRPMLTNTIYINPEDYPITEETTFEKSFFHDKTTSGGKERFTHLVSDKVDKKNGLKVTITVEPLNAKKTTKKTAKKKKKS